MIKLASKSASDFHVLFPHKIIDYGFDHITVLKLEN